jgi:hypothetical protein
LRKWTASKGVAFEKVIIDRFGLSGTLKKQLQTVRLMVSVVSGCHWVVDSIEEDLKETAKHMLPTDVPNQPLSSAIANCSIC